MISLCVSLFTFLSTIGLFSYAHHKVINNIQLWLKGLKILIHPPSQYYLFLIVIALESVHILQSPFLLGANIAC